MARYTFTLYRDLNIQLFLVYSLSFHLICICVAKALCRVMPRKCGAKEGYGKLSTPEQYLVAQRLVDGICYAIYAAIFAIIVGQRLAAGDFQNALVEWGALFTILPHQFCVMCVQILTRPLDRPLVGTVFAYAHRVLGWVALSAVVHQCPRCDECDLDRPEKDAVLVTVFMALLFGSVGESLLSFLGFWYKVAKDPPRAACALFHRTWWCAVAVHLAGFVVLVAAFEVVFSDLTVAMQVCFFPWALGMVASHCYTHATYRVLSQRLVLKVEKRDADAAEEEEEDGDCYRAVATRRPTSAADVWRRRSVAAAAGRRASPAQLRRQTLSAALRRQSTALLGELGSPRHALQLRLGASARREHQDGGLPGIDALVRMRRGELAQIAAASGLNERDVARMDRADLIRTLCEEAEVGQLGGEREQDFPQKKYEASTTGDDASVPRASPAHDARAAHDGDSAWDASAMELQPHSARRVSATSPPPNTPHIDSAKLG